MSGESVPPGWYPDPAGSGGMRWWDGGGWSQQVAPPAGEVARVESEPAPRMAVSPMAMVAAGLVIVAVVALIVGAVFVANRNPHGTDPRALVAAPGSTTVSSTTVSSTTPRSTTPTTTRANTVPVAITAPTTTLPPTAMATNGESALIDIDPQGGTVMVETNIHDIRYVTCASFTAASSTGSEIGLAGLHPGDFATVDVDNSVPCLRRVAVLAAPQPPACSAVGYGGGGVVGFVGYNQSAHSVLYLPTGPNEQVLAARWCQDPPVVGADGSATTFSRIAPGSMVDLMMSRDDWITGVTVKNQP